jgi:SAM domain (Sterile alpha motif)
MQQIADWLEKLGMSEYAQRFVENDIDVEVLSELTERDFDRLGVSIGHRRKMMRAITCCARLECMPFSRCSGRSADRQSERLL